MISTELTHIQHISNLLNNNLDLYKNLFIFIIDWYSILLYVMQLHCKWLESNELKINSNPLAYILGQM